MEKIKSKIFEIVNLNKLEGSFLIFCDNVKFNYDILIKNNDESSFFIIYKSSQEEIYNINGELLDIEEISLSKLQIDNKKIAKKLLLNFLNYSDYFLSNAFNIESMNFEIEDEDFLGQEKDYYLEWYGKSESLYLIDNKIKTVTNKSPFYRLKSKYFQKTGFPQFALRSLIFATFSSPFDEFNILKNFQEFAEILIKENKNIDALNFLKIIEKKLLEKFNFENIDLINIDDVVLDLFDDDYLKIENAKKMKEIYFENQRKMSKILFEIKEFKIASEILENILKFDYNIEDLFYLALSKHNLGESEESEKLFKETINFSWGSKTFFNSFQEIRFIKIKEDARLYLK